MDKNETWKDIPEYEGYYQISNLGRVKSLERLDSIGRLRKERILKPNIDSRGYYQVTLSKNGNKKFPHVHILVLTSFLKNLSDKYEGDHINKNKLDNHLEDLRWVTRSQNIRSRGILKNNTSGYVGVTLSKTTYKNKTYEYWLSRICVRGKSIYLGHFKDSEDAAHAYDEAAIKYHKEFATLNFARDYYDEK